MRRRPRTPTEIFSLSFLDCLCCGFGAILLLFLLTVGTGDQIGAEDTEREADMREMRERWLTLESERIEKNRRLEEARERDTTRSIRDRVLSEIREIESLLAATLRSAEELESVLNARQMEIAAAERILRNFPEADVPPIGLPTDASHLVFVIDTSGSMRNQLTGQMHPAVIGKMQYVIDNLPDLRFLQFIDTSGNYMLGDGSGRWLPDTPALRSSARTMIRDYPRPSASDPFAGMERAFRDLLPRVQPGERIGMFVVGDDVRRATSTLVVATDRLNPRDPRTGKRRATISGLAFPMLIRGFNLNMVDGSTRFANVMREIVEEHGGILMMDPL